MPLDLNPGVCVQDLFLIGFSEANRRLFPRRFSSVSELPDSSSCCISGRFSTHGSLLPHLQHRSLLLVSIS
jgi:hypothetical protein